MIIASVAVAVVCVAAALRVVAIGPQLRWRALAAGLLVLGIVGLHFTAMAALIFEPDPLSVISTEAGNATGLAVGIAAVAALIVAFALTGYIFDLKLARRAAIEAELASLGGDGRTRARQLDLVRFQLDELVAAGLASPEEDDALDAEEDLLAGAAAHREAALSALALLTDDAGALDVLGAAVAAVGHRAPFGAIEERLRNALAELKPSEREAVVLRYDAGLSFREVAAACGVDEAAARKRVSRALSRLRASLAES